MQEILKELFALTLSFFSYRTLAHAVLIYRYVVEVTMSLRLQISFRFLVA